MSRTDFRKVSEQFRLLGQQADGRYNTAEAMTKSLVDNHGWEVHPDYPSGARTYFGGHDDDQSVWISVIPQLGDVLYRVAIEHNSEDD